MTDIPDAIIVGAGFTGLSAALELKRHGARVLVLEARDRVGGRVESRLNALGERVDTGGQFVCDDMPNVMALLKNRGHVLFSPSFSGKAMSVPPLPQRDLARVGTSAMAIRERYLTIDPDDPSIAGLTVAGWLGTQPDNDVDKAAFRSMIEGLWCHALEDVPLWFMIDNDRRITNERYEL
jgi:monoamine oxidase